MSDKSSSVRIGIYGEEESGKSRSRGCGLWPVGNAASITAAGGTPVSLHLTRGRSREDLMDDLDGVVFAGGQGTNGRRPADDERLCEQCRVLRLPFLGIDHGLHVLNTTFGGTLYLDLAREFPQALQHRHPPEDGLRHAIMVLEGTRLAQFYGEGEIVVNSKHRGAVNRVARGFCLSGQALDGVVEAIETETDDWFAMGVQWQPASATASGLDIQVFRGFIERCRARRRQGTPDKTCQHAA